MEQLTDAQARVFKFVQREIERDGVPPTFRAIAKQFGFKSTRAAQDHVAALIRKGYLERKPGVARGLRLPGRAEALKNAPLQIPLVGQIAAGSPRGAEQVSLGSVPVPREAVKGVKEAELFALRITGDSMMDAGILEGDIVIARTQKTAAHGDIVVALLDGESTVKRLHRRDGRILLVPENRRMKPIAVGTRDLVIQGRVVGVQRFY